MQISLKWAQGQIFQDRTRFRVLVSGRRFGKTYLSLSELLRGATERPKGLFVYTAPTYRMAKSIAWLMLKEMVPAPWVAKVHEAELSVTLVNGARIELKGVDNPVTLRGLSVDGVVLDEAAFYDAEVWRMILRPALADKQGWALFTTTPCGTASWFYDLFTMATAGEDPDWKAWQFTTLDGDNVPPEEVAAARKDLDARTFKQEFEASFENFEGLVAVNFSQENVTTDAVDLENSELLLGIDFNVDPFVCLCAVKRRIKLEDESYEELHIFAEIILSNCTTWDMAEALNERFGLEREKKAYPDPTGNARKTSSAGQTDHMILRQSGISVIAPRKPWKIKDKVTAVNTALLDGAGRRRLKVNPCCVETIKSFRGLVYNTASQLPDKRGGLDHAFDAAGYLCLSAFNLTRPEVVQGYRVW
jgi:hypothetical protein